MPPIDYAAYLLEYAFEIGIAKSGLSGPVSISWSDIQAWECVTGIKLLYWESKTIIELSRVFVSQYVESDGTLVPSPYQKEDFDRGSVSKRVGSIFRSLMARRDISKARKKDHVKCISYDPSTLPGLSPLSVNSPPSS